MQDRKKEQQIGKQKKKKERKGAVSTENQTWDHPWAGEKQLRGEHDSREGEDPEGTRRQRLRSPHHLPVLVPTIFSHQSRVIDQGQHCARSAHFPNENIMWLTFTY